jgi:hypothetical protein
MQMEGQRQAPAALPLPPPPGEEGLIPTVEEAGLTPGPVWTGVENVTPTGIRYWDWIYCKNG